MNIYDPQTREALLIAIALLTSGALTVGIARYRQLALRKRTRLRSRHFGEA